MLDETTVEKFKASLRGELIQPNDEGYDDARKVWNAMIDKRPAHIVRCSGTADVIAAVNFAREHDLRLSVCGGGHNIAGTALCDNGLTIDLSGMKGIHVDLKTRTVRAQPGCNLGDLDREIGDAREILTYGKPGIGAEGANDTFCRIHYICID